MKQHGGIAQVNREHAARNNDHSKGVRQGQRAGGSGRDTNTIAGSTSMHQAGPKASQRPASGSASDVQAVGRLAKGRFETGKK